LLPRHRFTKTGDAPYDASPVSVLGFGFAKRPAAGYFLGPVGSFARTLCRVGLQPWFGPRFILFRCFALFFIALSL